MGNEKRFRAMQNLVFGDAPKLNFIPTDADIRTERARTYAGHKLLAGWDAKDVIDSLVLNGMNREKARKIVVALYNRITTPYKQLGVKY